jgi:hypothetical protein
MTDWRGYFGIENINLNEVQKSTLVQELRSLGPTTNPQPACLNHWRTRLDNEAEIYEALFDEDNLTIAKFKHWLGALFDVDPATIDDSTVQRDFSGYGTPIVTFSRSGTDYLRMALFGGKNSTWEESRLEALGYLSANLVLWEDTELI